MKEGRMKNTKLSDIQQFVLNMINSMPRSSFNPGFLGKLYYMNHNWENSGGTSRHNFGRTAAGYRACRKLASMLLIKEIKHTDLRGYTSYSYASLEC